MVIRKANPNDKSQITTLVASVIEEFGLPSNAQYVAQDLDTAFNLQASNQSCCWVAEVDNSIIGSVLIIPSSSPQQCSLKRFYIAKQYRGQRLGSQLYSVAEDFARSAGYQQIRIGVSRRFKTAILFYHHRSYQWVQDIDNQWEDTIYIKQLN